MPPRWIDAHCHRPGPGPDAWLLGGIDPADWTRQRALCRNRPGSFAVFGLHPWAATGDDDAALNELERALPDAAALGETGLDASSRWKGTLAFQRRIFLAQLPLAKRFSKPLVLHVVGSHAEVLEALRRNGPFPRGGLVHGFTGSAATAEGYIRAGFLISVGHRPCPALARLPGKSLVVESDADGPSRDFMTIARAAAEVRDEPVETLLDRSAANLRRLLELG